VGLKLDDPRSSFDQLGLQRPLVCLDRRGQRLQPPILGGNGFQPREVICNAWHTLLRL
jgi:hypothetical protein